MKQLKRGSPEHTLLKRIDRLYNKSDISNTFSIEEQASPLKAPRVTLDDFIEKNMPQDRVRKAIKNIEAMWELPNEFPSGIFPRDEARIRRLARQSRLRHDGNGKKGYKQDQVYLFMGELGCCATYGDPNIYKGLPIFLEAQGYIRKLKGVIMQGGLFPENPALWSRNNQERAKQVAKSIIAEERKIDEDEIDEDEADERGKELLEVFKRKQFTKKDREYYLKFVKGTPNTYEEIAEDAAWWLSPLFSNIPSDVATAYQFSMADYFNCNELLELIIMDEERRTKNWEKIEKNLPGLEEKHTIAYKEKAILEQVFLPVADYIISRLKRLSKARRKEIEGRGFTKYIEDKIYSGPLFKPLQKRIRKNLMKELKLERFGAFKPSWSNDAMRFEDFFKDALFDYSISKHNLDDVIKTKGDTETTLRGIYNRVSELENGITELKILEEKLKEEEKAGHSWLTGKAHISNEESKIAHYINKLTYKGFIKLVFKEMARILKKTHDVRILSSPNITLSQLTSPGSYRRGKLFASSVEPIDTSHYLDIGGMTIAMIPNPDFQASSVPKIDDSFRLLKISEEAYSESIARGDRVRKTKYQRLQDAKIYVSSWGAGGIDIIPKQKIGETWLDGQYRPVSERVIFAKLAPMHSYERLANVSSRWVSRTWAVKRFNKGGFQAGPLIYVNKANEKPFCLFPETSELAEIGEKYWQDYNEIKTKLKNKKLPKKEKQELKGKLENILEQVKFKYKTVLLSDDQHAGVYDVKGRPISIDTVRTTLTNVLDELNPDFIKASEMLNGTLQIGKFNIKEQGKGDIWTVKQSDMYFLERAMKNKDITKGEHEIMKYLHAKEQEAVESRWKLNDQLDIHEMVVKRAFEHMMQKGTEINLLDGNHCEGEARQVAGKYDRAYRDAGRLVVHDSQGDGDRAYAQIELDKPTGLLADAWHKTWGGKTGLSNVHKQLLGTRTQAKVAFTSHKHHGQFKVASWKAMYLDHGHQTDNLYVKAAGKTGSLRGSLIAYVPKDGRFIWGCQFIDDVSNDEIMGWRRESELLTKMHSSIWKYKKPLSEEELKVISKASDERYKIYQKNN